ncbi:hypothetical protein B7P43_G04555 [Cryptotermes secundus]|uniref:Tc1-like transposase DDE domain-containing protein n=1 Tax=Cryptotermes secundus TaxID=105785 RepID=A0A2J7QLI4_9NEOP|nr:hypothetical protein B7P43_G04555 [Cryptotermes secundus]
MTRPTVFCSASECSAVEGSVVGNGSRGISIAKIRCRIRLVKTESPSACQTVNQVYYKEVLTILCERERRRAHHDNVPAHKALSVKTFLAKHKIPMLEHPPYSPDLDPCDFFISKDQVCIKSLHFESIDVVKAKVMEVMKKLSEKDLQHCFQQWKLCVELCRGREGTTLKVITFQLCDWLNDRFWLICPVILQPLPRTVRINTLALPTGVVSLNNAREKVSCSTALN